MIAGAPGLGKRCHATPSLIVEFNLIANLLDKERAEHAVILHSASVSF